MHDPYAMDMSSGISTRTPELARSVVMVSMDNPDDAFRQSTQETEEDANFLAQSIIDVQVSPVSYSDPNTTNPLYSNTAFMDPQWQNNYHIVQEPATFFDDYIPTEDSIDSLFPRYKTSYPEIGGDPSLHSDSEEQGSELEQLVEMMMERTIRDQMTWQNDQQQHKWAAPGCAPSCMTPYPVGAGSPCKSEER